MPAPTVSVVIPAFNAAGTICQAVNSVLSQQGVVLQLIVVDDGSTDDTPRLLARYQTGVTVVSKINGGLASARNAGCAIATAQYIAFLDADDLCYPGRLATQAILMQMRPELVLCCSGFDALTVNGLILKDYASRYYAILAGDRRIQELFPEPMAVEGTTAHLGDAFQWLVHGNFIHPPTIMVRRSVVDSGIRFDERIVNMCDWEWLLRVSRLGPVGYIDRSLVQYRISDTQLSGPKHRESAARDILQIRERLLDSDSLTAEQRRRVLRAVRRSVLTAADIQIDSNRLGAIAVLTKLFRYGVHDRLFLRVLTKLMVPRRLRKRRLAKLSQKVKGPESSVGPR